MNRIALFTPYKLEDRELEQVFDFLYEVIDDSHLSVLFYRSCDIDLVRFFLELPDEYATHLTIHLPNNLYDLEDEALAAGIKFLRDNGTNVVEHNYPTKLLQREEYNEILANIIRNVDEVLSFYKRDEQQISKLLLPFNHSKRFKKKGYIAHLDKDSKKNFELVPYTI